MPKDYEKRIDRAFANYKTRCARYAHLFDEPLREATERVAAVVTSASKPKAKMYKIRS
jgi:hypothetical protein